MTLSTQLQTQPPEMPRPPIDIALTLSGGGFRATLFHLGVIRFLHENRLIGYVRHVCSVSGGSILAAHLALNWESYTGDPRTDAFRRAADKLIQFIQSDVRGKIVRSWMFSYLSIFPRLLRHIPWQRMDRFGVGWERITQLERHYAELFGGKTLADLMRQGGASNTPPALYLLATSATTGDLCSFTGKGFQLSTLEEVREQASGQRIIATREVLRKVDTGLIPVALAVAASSAFPVLFPPVLVDHDRLRCSEQDFPTPQRLTDGGVFENLGIFQLRLLHKQGGLNISHALISDAQAQFDWDLGSNFSWATSRASRTTDILMNRISDYEKREVESYFDHAGVKRVECRIGFVIPKEADRTAFDPAVQREVAEIRTDLDRFSDLEVNVLLHQGYASARRACEGVGLTGYIPADQKGEPWSPIQLSAGAATNGLVQSRHQRWQLWRFRDRWSWLNLILLLFWLTAGGFCLVMLDDFARAVFRGWVESPILLQNLGETQAAYLGRDAVGQLTPSERVAYEGLVRLAEKQQYEIVRVRTPPLAAKVGRHRIEPRRCRVVFGETGEFAPIGLTVFRVHPLEDQLLYDVLPFTPVTKPQWKPGTFDFEWPASLPEDYLFILSCVPVKPEQGLPKDPNSLIRLEYPQ